MECSTERHHPGISCDHRSAPRTKSDIPRRSAGRPGNCGDNSWYCHSHSKHAFRGGVDYGFPHTISSAAGAGSDAFVFLCFFQSDVDSHLDHLCAVSPTASKSSVLRRVVLGYSRSAKWRSPSDDGTCIRRLLSRTDNVASCRDRRSYSFAETKTGHRGAGSRYLTGCY